MKHRKGKPWSPERRARWEANKEAEKNGPTPARNPFRDLHVTLDAYFAHLGLEEKMDAVKFIVTRR